VSHLPSVLTECRGSHKAPPSHSSSWPQLVLCLVQSWSAANTADMSWRVWWSPGVWGGMAQWANGLGWTKLA
jgi:hypothetical protein